MDALRILLVEDNPGDAQLVRIALREAAGGDRADLAWTRTLAEGIAAATASAFDAVLLDLSLPDSLGLASLDRFQAAARDLPVVVLTGLEDERVAVSAVRAGAQDYLVKGGLDGVALRRAVRYAIERKRATVERAATTSPAILADVRRHLELLDSERRALERVLTLAGGSPSSPPLAPGALVADRYRLARPLGRGAIGTTFLARDETLGRPVCLKVLHRQRARDPEVVADFLKEARTAARIEHPNVVRVYDFGYAGELPFLVLEYAEGGSLADLLAEERALDATRAARAVADVLAGLAFVHERGTVHGDLKPANVLCDASGVAKISDFGLARDSSETPDPASTQVGLDLPAMPRGTPAYMSPEIARGAAPSVASDVYATGALLHELLAGATYLDFTGLDAREIQRAIRETAPRALPASVPRALARVVARALEKDPARRYASAAAMSEDLAAASTVAKHEERAADADDVAAP